jgi:hypothetical protein
MEPGARTRRFSVAPSLGTPALSRSSATSMGTEASVHRSRLPLLVIVAAAAACSTHGSSKEDEHELLAHDSTLAAELGSDQGSTALGLPAACGVVTRAAPPAASVQHRAEELTRQALDAEIHGNIGDARSLLRSASALDATNKSAAYHLGRTSEELHDSSSAMRAFCRYLALRPTPAESAEASMRVARLAPRAAGAAASTTTNGSAAFGASNSLHAGGQRIAGSGGAHPSTAAAVPRHGQTARSSQRVIAAASGGSVSLPARQRVVVAPAVDDSDAVATSGGEVVATSRPVRDADPPPSAPSTARRGPSAAQGAVIGAASGAIIGAVTGRSVKSAVVGAAAGGLLGAVVVRAGEPRRRLER